MKEIIKLKIKKIKTKIGYKIKWTKIFKNKIENKF